MVGPASHFQREIPVLDCFWHSTSLLPNHVAQAPNTHDLRRVPHIKHGLDHFFLVGGDPERLWFTCMRENLGRILVILVFLNAFPF